MRQLQSDQNVNNFIASSIKTKLYILYVFMEQTPQHGSKNSHINETGAMLKANIRDSL